MTESATVRFLRMERDRQDQRIRDLERQLAVARGPQDTELKLRTTRLMTMNPVVVEFVVYDGDRQVGYLRPDTIRTAYATMTNDRT